MPVKSSPRTSTAILNGILLVFVAVILIFSIFLVRAKLLQNAQHLGMALVSSYAVEEEMSLRFLMTSVDLAGQYMEDMIEEGEGSSGIQTWLARHSSKFSNSLGADMVDFYAVIDGSIVAAVPWEGDEAYPYQQTDWYLQALAAGGETVCGDVYLDAITGQRICTISKALSAAGDVLAMGVYIQNSDFHNTAHSLPEECSYYLCDQNGQVLYSVTKWDMTPEKVQSYADYLIDGISSGSLLAYDAMYEDADGVRRGVYYQEMYNGWTVIMTIPINRILMGEENLLVPLIAAIAFVLFLVLVLITAQDLVRSRRMKRADDTAHMLGDSFYAIYRINVRAGTYEAFKLHESLRDTLPPVGDYSLFLQTMSELVRPSTFQAFENSFSLASIRQRMELRISDYGGDYQRRFGDVYRWVNIRSLYNHDLFPDEVILCFRDVDEEKRQELQHSLLLQDALSAAEESSRAKSQFFSNMSHDMRTPLNAVIGCCDLAQASLESGECGKLAGYLRKISFAGEQLLNLINNILELSRMEAGKSHLEQKELNLRKLLTDLTDIFRDRAQADHKILELNIDLQEDTVIGDQQKMTQVINNLLSNAVKYTNPGDRIRVEARQVGSPRHSSYQFIVEDTGIGMTPQFLEHLFDPYSRETAFTSQQIQGTGLGMPIVKSLVQQMGGTLSVDSALGEGTRFTVTIPFQTFLRAESPALAAPPVSGDFCWTGRRILVAEDNDLNREIITAVLNQFGAEVVPAVNGSKAVEAFSASPPGSMDAVLLDIQMPEMDGFQAASVIRRLDRPDARSVPIVAVTANAFAEDIDRSVAAGMNDHVAKPINSETLRQVLEKLIIEWDGRRHAADALKDSERTGGISS